MIAPVFLALVLIFFSETLAAEPSTPHSASTCELKVPDGRTDRSQAAYLRKLSAQRKQFEKLKADAEVALRKLPPSQRREELERRITELGQLFTDIDNQPHPCPVVDKESQAYVHEVVRRIEECGTRNFPKSGGKSLYGTVTVNFSANRSGDIDNLDIQKSSGVPEIDGHSLQLVRASAPFGAVPPKLHQDRYIRFQLIAQFNFERARDSSKSPQPNSHCAMS